jgi:hypothetical protein
MQNRFNQTFGDIVVCSINTRQRVMLSIIYLGLLEKKIKYSCKRSDIKKFVKIRNSLNNLFNQFEEETNVECAKKKGPGRNPKALRN